MSTSKLPGAQAPHGRASRELNDLYLFAKIGLHGGFTAASRILGVPKSRLSRRTAALEERLGTRLVQRSTRNFAVTAAGQVFLQHCLKMLAEADAAEAAVLEIQSKPRGHVRISCPISMAHSILAPLLPPFLIRYPDVQISVVWRGPSIKVIDEGIDIAILVHPRPLEDSSLVTRAIGISRQSLVASPLLFAGTSRPESPADLQRIPLLSAGSSWGGNELDLSNDAGEHARVTIEPRLESESLLILKEAAICAIGAVRLPNALCGHELGMGKLEVVLPGWSLPAHEIHLVYPSRKGITPAVRTLIEHLAENTGPMLLKV